MTKKTTTQRLGVDNCGVRERAVAVCEILLRMAQDRQPFWPPSSGCNILRSGLERGTSGAVRVRSGLSETGERRVVPESLCCVCGVTRQVYGARDAGCVGPAAGGFDRPCARLILNV